MGAGAPFLLDDGQCGEEICGRRLSQSKTRSDFYMDFVCKVEVEEIEVENVSSTESSEKSAKPKKRENKEERLSIQDRVRCLDEFNKPENADKNNRLGLDKISVQQLF